MSVELHLPSFFFENIADAFETAKNDARNDKTTIVMINIKTDLM